MRFANGGFEAAVFAGREVDERTVLAGSTTVTGLSLLGEALETGRQQRSEAWTVSAFDGGGALETRSLAPRT